MRAHYIDNPEDDALSSIVELGQVKNPHLLLSQRERVKVAIRNQINRISTLSDAEHNTQPSESDSIHLSNQQQLHQWLSNDNRVHGYIFNDLQK